jgi:hypothetical protein
MTRWLRFQCGNPATVADLVAIYKKKYASPWLLFETGAVFTISVSVPGLYLKLIHCLQFLCQCLAFVCNSFIIYRICPSAWLLFATLPVFTISFQELYGCNTRPLFTFSALISSARLRLSNKIQCPSYYQATICDIMILPDYFLKPPSYLQILFPAIIIQPFAVYIFFAISCFHPSLDCCLNCFLVHA